MWARCSEPSQDIAGGRATATIEHRYTWRVYSRGNKPRGMCVCEFPAGPPQGDAVSASQGRQPGRGGQCGSWANRPCFSGRGWRRQRWSWGRRGRRRSGRRLRGGGRGVGWGGKCRPWLPLNIWLLLWGCDRRWHVVHSCQWRIYATVSAPICREMPYWAGQSRLLGWFGWCKGFSAGCRMLTAQPASQHQPRKPAQHSTAQRSPNCAVPCYNPGQPQVCMAGLPGVSVGPASTAHSPGLPPLQAQALRRRVQPSDGSRGECDRGWDAERRCEWPEDGCWLAWLAGWLLLWLVLAVLLAPCDPVCSVTRSGRGRLSAQQVVDDLLPDRTPSAFRYPAMLAGRPFNQASLGLCPL
jgi:hypothetical protein